MRKASAKKSWTRKASASKNKSRKPVDLQEVRETIGKLVETEAEAMASALVEEAKKGQLAPSKFLFEMIGLYPVAAPATGSGEEDGEESTDFARVMLRRMGIPGYTDETVESEAPVAAAINSVE